MTGCPHTCCDGECPGHRLEPLHCVSCALIDTGAVASPADARIVRSAVLERVEAAIEDSA